MKKAVIWIALLSLALRVFFVLFTNFGRDEIAVYNLGLEFYLTGQLPHSGAEIVYSGTRLPGALQALLTGLPLYLSKGLPWGPAVFVAVLNWLAAVMIFLLYKKLKLQAGLFRRVDTTSMAALIFFAPWTILFTNLWNPSYLPVLSVIFFYGIVDLIYNPRRFGSSFLVFFSLFLILQLHLSFVLLLAVIGLLLITRIIAIPNLKASILGTLMGSLTLVPYFLKNDPGSFIGPNVVFKSDSLLNLFLNLPKIFFRLLSFPTGETSRFLSATGGMPGTISTLNAHPWLWPFYIIGIAISLWLVWTGVSFYLRKEFFTPTKKLDFLLVTLPFLTWLTFFFSIKGPSAHTFWILMPLSFYPLLRMEPWLLSGSNKSKSLLLMYIFVITTYSCMGYVFSPKSPLLMIQKTAAEIHSKNPNHIDASRTSLYPDGVQAVLHALDRIGGGK